MKKRRNMKSLSSLLCMMLIVAMALFTIGCHGGSNSGAASSEGEARSANSNVLG